VYVWVKRGGFLSCGKNTASASGALQRLLAFGIVCLVYNLPCKHVQAHVMHPTQICPREAKVSWHTDSQRAMISKGSCQSNKQPYDNVMR